MRRHRPSEGAPFGLPLPATALTGVASGSSARRRAGLLPAALLAYHHVGYPLLLWACDRAVNGRPGSLAADEPIRDADLPAVAIVIAAHNEASVIVRKVADCLALGYPRDRLRIVVACDGCTDGTAPAARGAGADLVLELPRGGKMAAQHAAVAATDEPIIAFSDANSSWDALALRELVVALLPEPVGYVCGQVNFVREDAAATPAGGLRAHPGTAAAGAGADAAAAESTGTAPPVADNQEGVYWRYEMAIRVRESRLESVTAGNGAIYAIKRAAYGDYRFDPVMGHDLAMPFQLARAGWTALDVPTARARELMVPTIDGEFRRKRRMMSHAWPIVLRAGMLDLRGQSPRYALMLISHRWLRYAGPLLHGWLAVASVRGARRSPLARLLVAGQVLLVGAAARPELAPAGPARRLALLARYYVLTNAAIALGLRDHLVDGTDPAWTPPEGTR